MQNPMINIVNVFKRVVATSEFTFIKRIYCISQNLENGKNVGNEANNLNHVNGSPLKQVKSINKIWESEGS